MAINVALLKEISEIPGVPGHEQKVRELVSRELNGIVDSITIDNMGNLVALCSRPFRCLCRLRWMEQPGLCSRRTQTS